jgi:hypothetical protein
MLYRFSEPGHALIIEKRCQEQRAAVHVSPGCEERFAKIAEFRQSIPTMLQIYCLLKNKRLF